MSEPVSQMLVGQTARIAWHVGRARTAAGLTLEEAARRSGLPVPVLEDVERGGRTVSPEELDALAGAYGTDVAGLVPPRQPVGVDQEAKTLRADGHVAAFGEASDPLAVYLSMIYAVRSVERGSRIQLRDDDLDVLAGLVGEDPEEVERRLIELMGCSREEARSLCLLLFRRRVLAAAAALALAVSGVNLLGDGDGSAVASGIGSGARSVVFDETSTPFEGSSLSGTSATASDAIQTSSVVVSRVPVASQRPTVGGGTTKGELPAPSAARQVVGDPSAPNDRGGSTGGGTGSVSAPGGLTGGQDPVSNGGAPGTAGDAPGDADTENDAIPGEGSDRDPDSRDTGGTDPDRGEDGTPGGDGSGGDDDDDDASPGSGDDDGSDSGGRGPDNSDGNSGNPGTGGGIPG
ncbi:MAG: helix-turn-helix transcriptional regulator, partial [Actinomycetota bacterium]|nr:helix-turn-helix transcriptional regulator [Actinomycetota bacterium]